MHFKQNKAINPPFVETYSNGSLNKQIISSPRESFTFSYFPKSTFYYVLKPGIDVIQSPTLDLLKNPIANKRSSFSQTCQDDFNLNIGNRPWAIDDFGDIEPTSQRESHLSGLSISEPVNWLQSFYQSRKISIKRSTLKKKTLLGFESQPPQKLKEVLRRKSCHCSDCGGLSALEAKTLHLNSSQNEQRNIHIKLKIEEEKPQEQVNNLPAKDYMKRLIGDSNSKRNSPLPSRRKGSWGTNYPSSTLNLNKGLSIHSQGASTPKAGERRPSLFLRVFEGVTGNGDDDGLELSRKESIDFNPSNVTILSSAKGTPRSVQKPGTNNKFDFTDNNLLLAEMNSSRFRESHMKSVQDTKFQRSIAIKNNDDHNQQPNNPNGERLSLPVIYSMEFGSNDVVAPTMNRVEKSNFQAKKRRNGNLEIQSDNFKEQDFSEKDIDINKNYLNIPLEQKESNLTAREYQRKTEEGKKLETNLPQNKIFPQRKLKILSISERANLKTNLNLLPPDTETFPSKMNSTNNPLLSVRSPANSLRSHPGSVMSNYNLDTKSDRKNIFVIKSQSQRNSPRISQETNKSPSKELYLYQMAEQLQKRARKLKKTNKSSLAELKINLNYSPTLHEILKPSSSTKDFPLKAKRTQKSEDPIKKPGSSHGAPYNQLLRSAKKDKAILGTYFNRDERIPSQSPKKKKKVSSKQNISNKFEEIAFPYLTQFEQLKKSGSKSGKT